MKTTNELFKNPRIKSIFTLIVVIALSAVSLKFAKTLLQRNSQLTTRIKKDREELIQASKISLTLEALNAQITKLNMEISSAEEGFFSNTEEIFTYLSRFAQDSKIGFKSINPLERTRLELPNRKDIYFELVPVEVRLDCDYRQLVSFLKAIEDSKKFITAQDIKIQNNPQDIWKHNIELKLNAPLLIQAKG